MAALQISNISFLFGTNSPSLTSADLARADGRIDRNGDGRLDSNDKNGKAETDEIFQLLLGERSTYTNVWFQLRQAGLRDPLESLPEIADRVRLLFEKHRPAYEYSKALCLFRAVANSSQLIKAGSRVYQPFKKEEGGLEIKGNADLNASRRSGGFLLPGQLLNATGDRMALCFEYTTLLLGLLRAAGIKGYLKSIEDFKENTDHTFVLAKIDGKKYLLDPTYGYFEEYPADPYQGKFGPVNDLYSTDEAGNDRKVISMQITVDTKVPRNSNGQDLLEEQKLAAEIYPEAWYNLVFLGSELVKEKKYQEGLRYLELADRGVPVSSPSSKKIKDIIKFTYISLSDEMIKNEKYEEAIKYADLALKIDPHDGRAKGLKIFCEVWLKIEKKNTASQTNKAPVR